MQQQSCSVLLVVCPICEMDNRSDFIIDNQFLLEIINSLMTEDSANGSGFGQSSNANDDITKCPGCGEETPPTSWCI